VLRTKAKSSRGAGRPRLLALSPLGLARYRRELTQSELAARVGITRQYLGLLEAGKAAPSIGLALDLAEALDVPMAELFSSDANAAPPEPRSPKTVDVTDRHGPPA
jgi:putative transcriptional regulator